MIFTTRKLEVLAQIITHKNTPSVLKKKKYNDQRGGSVFVSTNSDCNLLISRFLQPCVTVFH